MPLSAVSLAPNAWILYFFFFFFLPLAFEISCLPMRLCRPVARIVPFPLRVSLILVIVPGALCIARTSTPGIVARRGVKL